MRKTRAAQWPTHRARARRRRQGRSAFALAQLRFERQTPQPTRREEHT